MKNLDNTPVNIFDSLLYETTGDVKKASFQAPKAYWDMLVRSGYTAGGGGETRYCKYEEIGKYFQVEGVTPIETKLPSQAELLAELEATKKELAKLKNDSAGKAEPVAPENISLDEEPEIDLNALNEEELRTLAEQNNVKLGKIKDIKKIRDKIQSELA